MNDETRIVELYGEAALKRIAAEQKQKLLPQLEKRWNALVEKSDILQNEQEAIGQAMTDINAGRITDYQIRKPKEATE